MKKILSIALIIVMGLMFAVQSHLSDYWTGSTTSDYVAQPEIVTQDYKQALIVIYNSGAQSMLYKVYGYADNSATYYEELVSETTITASGTDTVKIANTAYTKLIVSVKWVGSATTFEISYNLKP